MTASFVNPVAIEIAFEEPLPHWLGFIVSVQDGAATASIKLPRV
jgi:hypothetical protein